MDYAGFRRIWLNPVTERAEKGYLAACYERVAVRANSEGEYFLAHDAACDGLRCAADSDFPPHRLTAQKLTALNRSGRANRERGFRCVREVACAEPAKDMSLRGEMRGNKIPLMNRPQSGTAAVSLCRPLPGAASGLRSRGRTKGRALV